MFHLWLIKYLCLKKESDQKWKKNIKIKYKNVNYFLYIYEQLYQFLKNAPCKAIQKMEMSQKLRG